MTLAPNSRLATILMRPSLFVVTVLAVLEFCAQQAQATIYYVSTTGNQNNSGTSWSQAFKDLQETFVLTQTGDQVWVKAGTYTAPSNFTATDGVAVYGGFAGTETNIGQRNISAHATILTIGSSGAIYTVPNNATGTNTLDGFIVENGQDAGLYDSAADTLIVANCTFMGNGNSGIYTRGTSTITNCTFTGNGGMGGGGVSGDGPSTVTHCTFTSNTVNNGGYAQGGGYYDSSPCTVTDCTFTNNTADESGGGVYVSGISSTVTNCTFTGNSAVNGGGLFATGAADVKFCAFDANMASGQGGGAYETGATTIADCTFRGSRPDTIYSSDAGSSSMFSVLKDNLILGMGTSATDPDGIDVDTGNNNATSYITIANNTIVDTNVGIDFNPSGGAAGVANNILYGNDVGIQNDLSTFTHSITLSKNDLDQDSIQYNGVPRGSSDLFVDPVFVSAANNDYQLQVTSPLINAGDDSYVLAGDTDLNGNPRISGSNVDIGAYEYDLAPVITSFTPTSGPIGTVVTVTGTNLAGVTAVRFHNANATVFSANAAGTQLTVTVPSGAGTGTITVTTPDGTVKTATAFTVTSSPPTITSFTPASGPVGTVVTITGTNLKGTTAVRFHNANATVFSVNAAGTQLMVTVPSGAGTGTITVTTPGGSVKTATSFTVTASLPTVKTLAFSPTTIAPGGSSTGTVTLTGAALSGGAVVTVTLDSFTFASVMVAAGQTTGTFTAMAASSAPAGSYVFTASYNSSSASATLAVN